ncbi:Protein ApaG [Saliniradius amylolyticus]|uniref:Protein ApaG n=1 Tax=Saliniradius amylolyticus TaxID=2183582 RepID=A0A2S2E076_9ALTE|nr:Co2+/Mg2+ efflux protein ApaG [Saliniradius amylolyticus]AWL10942.1 Protein ApaG [Saliniradius amylolyticus]
MPPESIHITAEVQYLPKSSDPEQDQFAFAYHIRITNEGEQTVQLINRYWLITDGNGTHKEVAGSGVVGQQPQIAPGESYEYTSGAMLETPVGTMQGHYDMQTASGETFQAHIPVFTLADPKQVN